MRLTRPQRKIRSEIEGWLRDGEPDLSVEVEYVLDNYLLGWDPVPLGEFHTPPEMAKYVADSLLFFTDGARILDPCAGIGSLLYPLMDLGFDLEAIELSNEAAQVLRRLFPNLKAHHADAFDHLARFEGSFDYVIMNPPFGVIACMEDALNVCESGAKLSQHLFLELAIRSLKFGGQAIVIGPYNLIDRIPKKARCWFDKNMSLVAQHQDLPGEFKQTKIKVDAFIIQSIREPEPVAIAIATPHAALIPMNGKQLALF